MVQYKQINWTKKQAAHQRSMGLGIVMIFNSLLQYDSEISLEQWTKINKNGKVIGRRKKKMVSTIITMKLIIIMRIVIAIEVTIVIVTKMEMKNTKHNCRHVTDAKATCTLKKY